MGKEAPFRSLSLFDTDAVPLSEGAVQWIPLRRRLGISAFGTNAYRASAGDPVIEEHVESPGQEELYLILAGTARITVGGESLDAQAGMAVFVSDPTLRRRGEALEDGTIVLAVGGWNGQAYRSLPWEPIYMAQDAMRRGDWEGAAETLERESGEHRQNANVLYRLACCHAMLERDELALEELRLAIDGNPDLRGRAEREEHFRSLRTHEGWESTVG